MATRDRSGGTISVYIGEDLVERVNALAFLERTSSTELVKTALEEKIKPRAKEIATVVKLRKKEAMHS
jgi:hypothetical protein